MSGQVALAEWMPINEAKRLASVWTDGCDFENSPQWRAAMRVLLDEVIKLDRAVVDERERCAKLVESANDWRGGHGEPPRLSPAEMAALIRNEPNTENQA